MFKRSQFLFLILDILTNSDDSFAEKNGKVVFVGKSTTASTRLAFKSKELKWNSRSLAVRNCWKLRWHLTLVDALSNDGSFMTFKSDSTEQLFKFPIIAELSQN